MNNIYHALGVDEDTRPGVVFLPVFYGAAAQWLLYVSHHKNTIVVYERGNSDLCGAFILRASPYQRAGLSHSIIKRPMCTSESWQAAALVNTETSA